MIFAEHLLDEKADELTQSNIQTERIFNNLKRKLKGYNATIVDNVLRTWIYAPNVDVDYAGIVKGRNIIFDEIGLNENTHSIASTGIQGGTGDRYARVFMDAYMLLGISDEKIRYIQAPEYLSTTHIYGVSFERATAIEMGNTDFLFISGTASIDKEGEIVHKGDVKKQTNRTLENISALIKSAKFTKEDLSSFIVYMRDIADYNLIKPIIEEYFENLPTIFVKASVCRPGWLVEIEATAAKCLK